MLRELFRGSALARLEAGPMAAHLPFIASVLHGSGYAPRTIVRYIRSSDKFGRWLQKAGVPLSHATRSHVIEYGRSSAPSNSDGLACILEILRNSGVVVPVSTPLDDWLIGYESHLRDVHGLADATRECYVRHARALASELAPGATPDWSGLTAERIADWVQRHTAAAPGKVQPVAALRSVLRYLICRGDVLPPLQQAIPAVPHRQKVGLPKRLSQEEWQTIISGCSVAVNGSLRDRAIVLLMARLGLRAGEVRRLRLDDVNWLTAVITIRHGKSRRERQLPIPADVGALLADYLQQERPKSEQREVFLSSVTPHRPFRTSARISLLTKALINRLGIDRPKLGAHHLRHTVASQLVCQGASFKEAADVLGHLALKSTGIYAKLDEQALAQIALPWPGEDK